MKRLSVTESHNQVNVALDLIDFCGGDLSTAASEKFWQLKESAEQFTNEDRAKIFLTALSLLRDGSKKG